MKEVIAPDTKPFSHAKAIADGKLVRAYRKAARGTKSRSTGRRVYELSADEVIEIIREHVRRACGDQFLSRAVIRTSSSLFYIRLPYQRPLNIVADKFWRLTFKNGDRFRRHSLGLVFRALRGEELTGD